jgi:hypothetical protein
MTLPRPNATRDLFPSRSFFLQRGALARVGGFIRRFYRAPVSRAGQNRSLRRVGLLVLDFDDFGVTANLAFERAKIVIRLGRGLDPRETCQTTALGTRRPVQLDCVDLVRLSRAHDTSSPLRAGAVSHPHRCHPFKGQRQLQLKLPVPALATSFDMLKWGHSQLQKGPLDASSPIRGRAAEWKRRAANQGGGPNPRRSSRPTPSPRL